jgi:hypothetical protein
MMRFLEIFCVSNNDRNDSFRLGPAITMMVLLLTFVGAIIYILVSSLAG